MAENVEHLREEHGLFRNVPRFLRRAVERRLHALEADPERFDREALLHHGRLKRLHALLHVKPGGERARATLFGKPSDGPRAALRWLAATAQADFDRRNPITHQPTNKSSRTPITASSNQNAISGRSGAVLGVGSVGGVLRWR